MKQYKVIVKGDITGEGIVNLYDVVKLVRLVHNENAVWSGAMTMAGKVTNAEGIPQVADIERLISYCFDGVKW